MSETNIYFRDWMSLASTAQQWTMAKDLGTSVAYLYQLSRGVRKASAALAGQIEDYTSKLHDETGGKLPIVYRNLMCNACAACPYFNNCD